MGNYYLAYLDEILTCGPPWGETFWLVKTVPAPPQGPLEGGPWGEAETALTSFSGMGKNLRAHQAPNWLTVVLIVVIGTWVDIGAIQIQVVAIVVIVHGRRPIVAARPPIIRRRTIEVAGVEEDYYSK